jgi:N-acetylmuramoyl-L-alanine amidase
MITPENCKEIIVHCTASNEGVPCTVEQVRRFHVQKRGWSDIAYHYLIYLDGSVHVGRPLPKDGGHTLGHPRAIGVCYVGGLDKNTHKGKDTRTPAQKAALRNLLIQLKQKYPNAIIHGHREFANKACPCFDAKAEYADISAGKGVKAVSPIAYQTPGKYPQQQQPQQQQYDPMYELGRVAREVIHQFVRGVQRAAA